MPIREDEPAHRLEVTVLQGNIETFALPDVLRLLSSTKKTGRLHLRGDRGDGSVWVADGLLVAGEVSAGPSTAPVEVLFELLRFSDGDFSFDQDHEHASPGEPVDVEGALGDAEAMLEEWRALESVVPSMDAWLSLADALPGDEITISGDRWRSLAQVAGGARVTDLAERLGLGELPVLREVRDLLDLGVVEVGEAPASAPAPAAEPAPAPAAEPAPAPAPAAEEAPAPAPAEAPAPAAEEAPAAESAPGQPFPGPAPEHSGDLPPLVSFDGDEGEVFEPLRAEPAAAEAPAPAGDAAFEPFDPSALVVEDEAPAEAPAPADDVPAPVQVEAPELTDAEIAKQMTMLSPKAAKAVAAAARAKSEAEREEALRDFDPEDTDLNRDLLLKFLGSVNG